MKKILVLLLLFPSFSYGQVHYLYYKNIFGHLHQSPSSYAGSLKTLSCGDRVRLIQDKSGTITEYSKFSWSKVKYGPNEGYIRSGFLEQKRPSCFQVKYSKFFNKFKVELNDVFSWGRLYDQFVMGSSQVR
ncbi:MAG: hypothetical protein DRQ88_10135 [Epsilonproteobacteria bacterium]|nr:MAG: hypothetical protein DRQ89_08315 [Campylobacterota bacterium]RLA64886.1 MAG: hypothetical protein DRQ88_10135 [Campylobacterota bacterium]